jgi:hypothetical protein
VTEWAGGVAGDVCFQGGLTARLITDLGSSAAILNVVIAPDRGGQAAVRKCELAH